MMNFLKRFADKGKMQSMIVSLCILMVCIGTQQMQTVIWNSGIYEFSRDMLGVVMAVIICTNYKWNDFVKYKIPYIVWSVLGILLGVILVPMAIERRLDFLLADTIVIALGIFLMGYCVIHTFIAFFLEKYRPKFCRPLIIIWIVMFVLMIFSRSEYLWPLCYFLLFLCYYMTEQTLAQRAGVVQGLVNGMILAFIVIQAHSLLFRPYDRLRYYGNFCNPNHNCMFLCLCLGAILAKILLVTKADAKKAVRIFYFLLAGACCAFIFMTMSRSGYVAAFVVVLLFLIAYCNIKEKKIFFRTGLLMVALFVALLPVTYLAVRYIPTIHPHVLFYFQEGYSEDMVHSWDDRNSEKFTTFGQLLEGALGRLGNIVNSLLPLQSRDTERLDYAGFLVASGADDIPFVDPDKIPALTEEEEGSAFLIRYTIYKWYITHLSLRGMPYDEQGFQLTKDHWIQDTHNIYLDYGINFGYPVMILFTVFIWWGIGRLYRQGARGRNAGKWACLMIVLIPPVFGMFEFAWGAGMISTVSLYILFKEMILSEQQPREPKSH